MRPVKDQILHKHKEDQGQSQGLHIWQLFYSQCMFSFQAKKLGENQYKGTQNVSIKENYTNRLYAEIVPALRVFVPRPLQVIALVTFNEIEFKVVKDIVDDIGAHID